MLTDKQQEELNKLLTQLDEKQVIWLSGFLWGKAGGSAPFKAGEVAAPALEKITIIYVTETGNSKEVAFGLSSKFKDLGIKVKLKAAEQYRVSDLEKETHIILISSTHGEGEPPEVAKGFYDYVHENKLDLSKLSYAVLALGDSNYKFFCKTGNDFAKRFADLGGKEILPTKELDLDFAEYTESWYQEVITALSQKKPAKKEKPKGKIISNVLLNDEGSNKQTYHIEIEAEGVKYEVGDVLGIKLGDNSPRLYSISSSPNYHEGEIHLTVVRQEKGLCSNYLADLAEDAEIEFYIKPNAHFRLPSDDVDMIMVGPGTGVAPFRAFVAERDYRGASGRNWLFFGEQHQRTDFLYQIEWQEFLKSGSLTNIDLAFSRDGAEKVYVQHKLQEKAEEVKEWLDKGAYFYVCGDKEHMARDVAKVIEDIVGKEAFANMKESGRYLEDVY